MSALAQLYASKGALVTGSDRATSPVVELLHLKGIEVFIGHDAKHIHRSTTRVVYSDAIPKDNGERVWAREHGVEELSYFEALGGGYLYCYLGNPWQDKYDGDDSEDTY